MHYVRTSLAQNEDYARCSLPSDFEMPVVRQGWDEWTWNKVVVFRRQRITAEVFLALPVLA